MGKSKIGLYLFFLIVYIFLFLFNLKKEFDIIKLWKSFINVHNTYPDPADDIYKESKIFLNKIKSCGNLYIIPQENDKKSLNTSWVFSYSLYPMNFIILDEYKNIINKNECLMVDSKFESTLKELEVQNIYKILIKE